jgi:hypothetical protein
MVLRFCCDPFLFGYGEHLRMQYVGLLLMYSV